MSKTKSLIKELFGTNDPRKCHDFLWQCTPYPAGSLKIIESKIREYADKSGGDIDKAMQIAHEETMEEYKQYKESKKKPYGVHVVARKYINVEAENYEEAKKVARKQLEDDKWDIDFIDEEEL